MLSLEIKAKEFISKEMEYWTLDVLTNDPYTPLEYKAVVIGKYVFITTYRLTINLVDVYDVTADAKEIIFQYEDDEYGSEEAAYATITGESLIDVLRAIDNEDIYYDVFTSEQIIEESGEK